MKCRCDHILISILTRLATIKNSLLGSLSKDDGDGDGDGDGNGNEDATKK